MQRKSFSQDELMGMDSIEKLIFTDSSPFLDVSSPRRNVCNTLQGTLDSDGFQGTYCVYRYDSDATTPIKKYNYLLSMDANGKNGEIQGPSKNGVRYFNDIPSSLKPDIPKRFIERLEEFRRT